MSKGQTLATAESCTGGWVAQAVTSVAGCSDWFERGYVTYSNAAKREALGVPKKTLLRHGAVSEQTARAMAQGALRKSRAHLALAITGIAGPGGGSPDKPVGLTYVALADGRGGDVRRYIWGLDRSGNKRASAGAALDFVLERLETGPT